MAVIENVTSAPVIKPETIPANHCDDMIFAYLDRHGCELFSGFRGVLGSVLEFGILDPDSASCAGIAIRAPHFELMAAGHNYRRLRPVRQDLEHDKRLALVFLIPDRSRAHLFATWVAEPAQPQRIRDATGLSLATDGGLEREPRARRLSSRTDECFVRLPWTNVVECSCKSRTYILS